MPSSNTHLAIFPASMIFDLSELRRDVTEFRLLLAALIAMAPGLAGVTAKGFGWV